jgi:hypothetical protein
MSKVEADKDKRRRRKRRCMLLYQKSNEAITSGTIGIKRIMKE